MSEENTEKELSAEHQLFCEEYLICMSATKAYLKIYSDSSRIAARNNSSRLMANDSISVEIKRLRAERSKRLAVEADDVLQELKLLGFSDISDYLDFGPVGVTLKEMSELPLEMTRAVAKVSHHLGVEGGGSVEFKLHDKISALEKIGKHLGMFPNKHEVVGKDDGPVKHIFEIVDPKEQPKEQP